MVSVNEPGRQKTVILLLVMNRIGIHHGSGQKSGGLKCVQAYQGSNADNNVGDIQKGKDYVQAQT